MLRMKAQFGREDTLWVSDLFVFIKVSPSEAVQRGGFRSKWFCSSYACLVIVVYYNHDTHFHRPFTKCLDIRLLFWHHLILLMMFTGLMFHWSAVVHVQHCFTICSSAVFFLHLCVCVCVLGCVCMLLPVCACVQMHAYTSRERQVWGKQEKCIKGTAHRTYGMHSALSASGSWTQQNTRSNLIWLTVKQRNLRGPFETISRQSLQTIFLH